MFTNFDISSCYNAHSAVDKLGGCDPIDSDSMLFGPGYELGVFLAGIKGRCHCFLSGDFGGFVKLFSAWMSNGNWD
jgi:hypothetical protein